MKLSKWLIVAMCLVAILATVLSAASASTRSDRVGGCTRAERRTALAEDQRRTLARVDGLRRLDDLADVAALAARGWNVLPHGWNSFRGMGMAVIRGEEIQRPEPIPGRPELLFYRPDPGASDVTDPFRPDFPYELAGWGYLGTYDFAKPPAAAGPCFTRADWFVHERGIHDLRTLGFVPVPPEEDFHGQDPGNEPFVPRTPGFPHSRFWDMHLWLGSHGVPTVSMLNPGAPIPGIDPHVGEWFFYPPGETPPRTDRRALPTAHPALPPRPARLGVGAQSVRLVPRYNPGLSCPGTSQT